MAEGVESTSGIRVFAGGIGGSVGEDDIRRIFGKFGGIARVEIVRTKGRGFAYFDLVPSKPNSLNNLLSTYNGCAWKGGKLRLEKAREHYLARLRREWAEDSELSAAPVDINDAEKCTSVQEKSKKFLDSEKQLCMYFPKLRKVKSLPYRGTGKHKYSFQRVDVPMMPEHFCDCDEHADLTQSSKMEQPHKLEILDGGIQAEELYLMKLVINKLFQEEKCLESTQNGVIVPEEDISLEEYVTPGIEDRNGSMVDDDDDLVINIMSDAGNTKSISHTGEVLVRKKPDSNASDAPKDKSVQKLMVRQNGSAASSKKRRKSLISAEGLFKESSTANNGELAGHSNASVVEDDDDLVINVVPGVGNTESITQTSGFFAHEKPDSYKKDALKNQASEKRQKSLNYTETLHKESFVATEDELTICSNVSGENLISVSTGSYSESSRPKAQPLSSRKSPWKSLIGSGDDKSFSISNILSSRVLRNNQHPGPDDSKLSSIIAAENPTVVPRSGIKDEATEPQTLSDARMDTLKGYPSSIKSGRGSSWLHDSSWMQLVNSGDTSFSISHILPVSRCERSELAVGTAADKSGIIQLSNGPVEEGSDFDRLPSGEEGLKKSVRSSGMVFQEEDKKPGDGNNAESREMSFQSRAKMTPFVVTEEKQLPTTRVSLIGPDEPCPFMRSESSLRDWANTKAALTRSHKRKK